MMQENDTLRALLSLSAYHLVNYGYKNFGQNSGLVKYDGDILKSLQNSCLLFETDSLTDGEIWAISSGYKKIVFSNNIGQLNISVLDASTPKKLPLLKTERIFSLPVKSMVRSLSFDKGSNRLACGTLDGNVFLFDDIDSKSSEQKLLYNHNGNRVQCLAFVPGKNWLISSSTDKTIHIWDLSQQKTVKELILSESVQKFVLVGQDHLIFTNSTGNIFSFDLNKVDREPETIYTGNSRFPLQTIAYNSTHKWIVASSAGTLRVFTINPDNLHVISSGQFTVKHKSRVSQTGFTPDGNWFVSTSPDAIMLWDLRDVSDQDIDKLVPIVIDNNRQIFSVAFDEDSKYLFYGDNRILHIYPISINNVYSLLRSKMGRKELTELEWKYYVKGDLVMPGMK
jgi:WD40 repeat protein